MILSLCSVQVYIFCRKMFFTAGGLLCLLMTGSFSRQAEYMQAWYMQAQIKYYLNTIAV